METQADPPLTADALAERIAGVMAADARRLRKRLDDVRRTPGPAASPAVDLAGGAVDTDDSGLRELAGAIARAEARVERRRASVPPIRYPEELPVSQRRDDLAAAIRDHQVVVVAGETGSGKTTQLPKICLELGRGVQGQIGHTQPRRLAARTVAERIAEEVGTPLGTTVGYAVRFTDKVGPDSLVKVMTDGILLSEVHRDRTLSAYDTLIIDEAHERSLNIDFILGYLRQLLPRRPDLKVIVTSATIDPERFSDHFGGAPIVEVSGRTYPVEVRYRPLGPDHDNPDHGHDQGGRADSGGPGTDADRRGRGTAASGREAQPRDLVSGIVDAVRELRAEPPGDVLVFLSGEREIRDVADALRSERHGTGLSGTEVLPLYARLPTAEQRRVFAPHPGRRIVLATNVAETSLTVPGIRYVVDPGTARISRYSHRLKVQRLPIEAVSQASANQRAGRCGRVAPGVCIRLYSEEDFQSRSEFTEPEILRTNLASVILQMASLGLGDIAAFPFVEPPDRRAIADGARLLEELGALEAEPAEGGRAGGSSSSSAASADGRFRLSPVGRRLARLPVDPRFARMVLEAHDNGCLREVLVITAALSIEDPRERPAERAAAADQSHARFAEEGSDFLALLNLWRYAREQQRSMSSNQFRRLCRSEFLNHLRIREWQDVHSQLRHVAAELGMKQTSGQVQPDAVHRSLLAGLLSHVGLRDRKTKDFRGARNAHFTLWPGSSLARTPSQWVMVAELVETSRLWGRTAARIQPEWAEELAPHLVKHTYAEPHWSAERSTAMAYESVTLYGLPIVTRRLVGLGSVDPDLARDLFIRHALVDGDWRSRHDFARHNRELLAELEELSHRFRRHDLVADDDALHRLYDERVGERATSGRHFDSWWKKARRSTPDLLTFTADDLLAQPLDQLPESDFPATWQQGGLTLPLSYAYDPSSAYDGVTVHIPLAVLNQVTPTGFDWHVPGLRLELVTNLIRGLPKALRRNLSPAPDNAEALLSRIQPHTEPLLTALSREASRLGGERVPAGAWDVAGLPGHLRVGFVVEGDDGEILASGKDLAALKQELAPAVRTAISARARGIERTGITRWDFGELPRRHEEDHDGVVVVGYPALVDDGDSVSIRVLGHVADQHDATWAGTRRLLSLAVPVPVRPLKTRLETDARLALTANPYAGTPELLADCVLAAEDALLARHGAPVWDAVGFDRLLAAGRTELEPDALAVVGLVAQILTVTAAIDRRLAEPVAPILHPAFDDEVSHRSALVRPGFVAETGAERLADLLRYVRAASHRLDSLAAGGAARDRERMAQAHRVERAYAVLVDSLPPGGPADVELERIGWMLEELRVSLFAQHLGTPGPISEQRITRAMSALQA